MVGRPPMAMAGEKENKLPYKKRPCLSLKKTKGSRFQPVSPESVAKLAIPHPPNNTKVVYKLRNPNDTTDWHNPQAGAEQLSFCRQDLKIILNWFSCGISIGTSKLPLNSRRRKQQQLSLPIYIYNASPLLLKKEAM